MVSSEITHGIEDCTKINPINLQMLELGKLFYHSENIDLSCSQICKFFASLKNINYIQISEYLHMKQAAISKMKC